MKKARNGTAFFCQESCMSKPLEPQTSASCSILMKSIQPLTRSHNHANKNQYENHEQNQYLKSILHWKNMFLKNIRKINKNDANQYQ